MCILHYSGNNNVIVLNSHFIILYSRTSKLDCTTMYTEDTYSSCPKNNKMITKFLYMSSKFNVVSCRKNHNHKGGN